MPSESRGYHEMKIRRVITAKDDRGKSVFVSDEEVQPISPSFLPGVDFYLLCGGDEPPSVGPGAPVPTSRRFFPNEGGYRFVISTIPPGTVRSAVEMDKQAVIAEMEEKLPGLLSASEREPGMHASHTLDFVVILAGDVTLELDDNAKAELETGDVVVQIGARHRWHNRGTSQAVMLSGIMGASGLDA
jgi:mannose-6-phosphate isomerase-like protein (cupin superfamily)